MFLVNSDFKSLYSLLLVEDAMIQTLGLIFFTTIPNTQFIINLLDLVLTNSLMYFHQKEKKLSTNFGIIVGTNVASSLTTIYFAMSGNEF